MDDISQCIFSVNSTGQITLNVSTGQPQPEDAPEVTIDVIEDESVIFTCQSFPTLNVRRPEAGATFGTDLPDNLRPVVMGALTFVFQNVSRSDNGTAVQCRGGGGATNIGVIIVLCKLWFFRLGLC